MTNSNVDRIKILNELMQNFRGVKTVEALPGLFIRTTSIVEKIFGRDSQFAIGIRELIASIDYSQLDNYVSISGQTSKVTYLHITGWDKYQSL